MTQGSVNLEIINSVGYITFFHPSSNAMPRYLLKHLAEILEQAGNDNNIKAIVLQSEGRTFCAGASFDELMALNNLDQAIEFFMGFAHVINTIRQLPKFVITKVQGKAVGGGVGLIAASDFNIASEKAAIKLSELSIGIGPYVIGPAVRRKIGTAAFSELSIDATTWHTAYWAREKGLYAKVYDTQDELNSEVEILAEKLAGYDAEATRQLKRELWSDAENWDSLLAEKAKISAHLVLRDFTRDFLRKFKK